MQAQFESFVEQISTVIIGKKKQIRLALTCLFSGGHLLIEDMPGIGKTTLAKVISKCLGLKFNRIQCTSDMLPADITGISVFERKTGTFVFHPGPIFTQVLLADEINRATPKTQSALLEAMQEHQVTTEGQTRPLEKPFFVIATQNPLEQYGTFPLPESQLDRFLMRITLGYPGRAAEKELLQKGDPKKLVDRFGVCLTLNEVISIREKITTVHASDAMLEYLQDIIDFSRTSAHFQSGLSPRAGLALLRSTRAWAYLNGRDYALPEDMQHVMPWVLGHRLRSRDDVSEFSLAELQALLMEVPIP